MQKLGQGECYVNTQYGFGSFLMMQYYINCILPLQIVEEVLVVTALYTVG